MRLLTSIILVVALAWWLLPCKAYNNNLTPLTAVELATTTAIFSAIDTITYVAPNEQLDSLDITLPNCDDIFIFRSDIKDNVELNHLYRDDLGSPRNNVTTICPPSGSRRLLATFSSFDLSVGDTLLVYDGDNISAPLIDKASGTGVSQINGGWLDSNCDPSLNPTSCLTFQFITNGDGNKGQGWSSLISCFRDSTTTFDKPNDIFLVADCNTLEASINLQIPDVDVGEDNFCPITNDSVIVDYFLNEAVNEKLCRFRDTLRSGEIKSLVLPIGLYTFQYKLLRDTTIEATCIVSVSAPSFACNDTIITAIGQGCKSLLAPDDLLENFGTCAPFDNGSVRQFFVIHVETDTGRITGTSTEPPIINAGEDGNIVCNGFYEVAVTRVIEVQNISCSITSPNSVAQFRDSCSVTVNFVDGIRPVFAGLIGDTITEIDTIIACQDFEIDVDKLNTPLVFDNCELAYLGVTLPEIAMDVCDTGQLFYATWLATDQCGNTSTAVQKILVRRPSAEHLSAPRDTSINCGIYPSPDITGWPTLDTNGDGEPDIQLITDGGKNCFFDVDFRDDTIPHCGNAVKIIRYWSLRNFCSNEQSITPADTQVIAIIDTLAPIIFKPAPGVIGSASNPYIFPTSPTTCLGTPRAITPPGGVDSCDLNFETRLLGLYYPNGQVDLSPNLATILLPIGHYSVAYVHIDACGNRSDTCHIYFNIEDLQAPIAICTDEIQVSMTNGNFPIRPEDIDNGSTDNCVIDKVFIRRTICGDINIFQSKTNVEILENYGGRIPANGWDEYIEVGCCDINKIVRVELLVIDEAGNFNQCWLNVLPEDHLQPTCMPLPDTIVFCDAHDMSAYGVPTDLNHNHLFETDEWRPIPNDRIDFYNEQFGYPNCVDNINCNNISIEQEYQLIVDNCGIRGLRRRYRSVDFLSEGNVSSWLEQHIQVVFRPTWSVTFPPDTTLDCGTTLPNIPIIISSGTCDFMRWEVKEEFFEGSGEGCLKVFRNWQLINSCRVRDEGSVFNLPRDVGEDGHVPRYGNRTFNATDTVNGYILGDFAHFTYTQVIKVNDDTPPIISITLEDDCIDSANSCREGKTFTIAAEDCTPIENITFRYELFEGGNLVQRGEGTQIEYSVSPFELYLVQVEAFDNCGNFNNTSEFFGFNDCAPPTVICDGANVNLEINQSGFVGLPAAWLDNNSFDNCDPNISFRIWHSTVSDNPPTTFETASLLPADIILSCADIGISTAYMYVFDAEGNFASCDTEITVQDPNIYCSQIRSAKIVGNISTFDGNKIEGVEVAIENGTKNTTPASVQMTGTDGNFSFDATEGNNYTVIPKKNDAVRNGVSTFDIVMIQKHILKDQLLDSPYKYIAADVNKSGSITTFDIVQLRQVILNILPTFPNNESWRFVNATYTMDTQNPLSNIEEVHEVKTIQNTVNTDFIAIKIGDVSGNAVANNLLTTKSRNNTPPMHLMVENQFVQAGEQYDISFELSDTDYLGFQFSLQHNNLSFIDWQSTWITRDYIGRSADNKEQITVSWNQLPSTFPEFSVTKNIFTMTVEAQQDGQLSDFLSLTPQPTAAEAYTSDEQVTDIVLNFYTPPEKPIFEVYQNHPNPFSNSTSIGFYLPNDSPVTLSVMDVTGTILYQQTASFKAGKNAIILNQDQLPYTGLLYYQLASSTGKVTKPMLLIQ